jgi:lipoate-protein ligase A
MQLLDLTLASAAANLALDEALLLQAEAGAGGEVLRLWEWPQPAVVLGAAGVLADDVAESACQRDGVPILRRASGGGTVLLGAGCLCFSLVLSFERDPALLTITSSYGSILESVCRALAGIADGIAWAGTSDLAAAGRKFSGNAQQRKRHHLLHHGSLLYDLDLTLVSRYLRQPERQPDYRAGREHDAFLMNLPCSADELRRRLCTSWQATVTAPTWPEALVTQLVAGKYARAEWIRRR